MQGKVSMVMPCYNKAEYIGEMFDSIIAQEWDNIELILVNDGSTDGTREIIAEYEPRFRARGYEVVIVDQQNAGVCAAAKTGLGRVTGDYVCQVDADDELDPKYVSTMAGWLDENPEYDFVHCGGIYYTGRGDEKQFKMLFTPKIIDQDPCFIERWLFRDIMITVWLYMLRVEYFNKCRIAETYYTNTKGSHEPGYVIPIIAYGGKYKLFRQQLYHFNITGREHSVFQRFEQAKRYFEEYEELCNIAIEALPDDVLEPVGKNWLKTISGFTLKRLLYRRTIDMYDGIEYSELIFNQLLEFINASLSIEPPITRERTKDKEQLFIWLVNNQLHRYILPKGRIIGVGALGKRASRILPNLKGSLLEPTELWDAAGDGIIIKKPDYAVVNPNDTVLVLPDAKSEGIVKILEELKGTGCSIILSKKILNLLLFPEIINMHLNIRKKGRYENCSDRAD